jgi:myo-inositol-1(or 4)-monophosphatase
MVDDSSHFAMIAIQAAFQAGEILRRGFGTAFEIVSKPGKQNFVTEYDKSAEACIISKIKENFPSHSILAEESGLEKGQNENVLWIIDPLDGTTNFAHKIPLITISIAAYRENTALCGIIYQPFTQELFVAEKGKGAYLNGSRLSVSHTDLIEDALIVISLPYDIYSVPTLNMEGILQISRLGATLRNFGSAALALAYVAAGKVDAFWMYNLYPWDLAAGQLLIEEAGGIVTRYAREQLSMTHCPSNTLATNQPLHQKLKEYLEH